MKKEQKNKVKAIITEIVIEHSSCCDCNHFDNNMSKFCKNCNGIEKFKLSEIDKKYIKEKVELIKTALK